MGRATIPDKVWIVEAVFGLHALAAIATFHRTAMRPAWQPVLNVTPQRVRLAKILFILSILNFLLCVGVSAYAVAEGDIALRDKGVALILTSFLILNTV
jgi:hypothetical protein